MAVRSRRFSRRWVLGLAMTILALAAAWRWIVPQVVEAKLLAQLRQSGFGAVDVESVQVGFFHVTVRNLSLGSAEPGDGTLTIGAATAEFTWADLLDRRVGTLVIDGPTWTRSAVPGRASSPFDDVLHRRAEPGPMPTSSLPALPLRLLAIRSGTIVGPPGLAPATVTVDGTLTADTGQWNIAVNVSSGAQKLEATARLHEEQDHAAGTVGLRVLGPLPIELEGSCRLESDAAGRALALEVRRRPGPFEVSLPAATWSGDGDLVLQARVPFAHPDAAVLALRVEDFSLASTTGVQLSGLATDASLRGLPMPVSTGPQRVRWQRLQFAGIEAGSGSAEFQLHRGLDLRLQGRQLALDEVGSITVSEVRLAPGLHSFPTTVGLDRVPLREWLELLSGGRVTGEGRLSGSVSLVVQTEPRLSITVHEGRLAAAPGGVVRFLDDTETEGLIRQHVQQVAATTGHDAQVQERLVAALKEFTYTVMDFRIDRDAGGGGGTLRVHVAGAGRRVPQQLDLDLSLHGFDAAVDAAVAIKLGLDRAKRDISEKIVDRPDQTTMQRKPR